MGKKGKVGSLSIYFISNQKIRDNNCKELNWLKIPKLTRSVIPASLQVLEGAGISYQPFKSLLPRYTPGNDLNAILQA